MTTQTTLEKLAKAIRKDWTGVEWDQPSEDPRMDHEDAFCVARAALQALREPTEEMKRVMDLCDMSTDAWGYVLDAALQEKTMSTETL